MGNNKTEDQGSVGTIDVETKASMLLGKQMIKNNKDCAVSAA